MRKGGSKEKGSSFERKICKRLSLWLSYGTRDDLFWRSAMSGGRATLAFKRGGSNITQAGDITAIDELGMRLSNLFTVECKSYKDLYLGDLIFERRADGLVSHWRRACEDAERADKQPVLIAKQNFYPEILCTTYSAINKFGAYPKDLEDANVLKVYVPRLGMYCCLLKPYLMYFDPEQLAQ